MRIKDWWSLPGAAQKKKSEEECRVYCSDLGPSFFQFEQKQCKHWPTNTHLPGVTLPFLNTYSPCTHTESNQKATAGCRRSPGVKSMAVKPKVINNGTGRDVVHTHCRRGQIEETKWALCISPAPSFVFLSLILMWFHLRARERESR